MREYLFNPFNKFSEKSLIFFGVTATLIGSYFASIFNARFDGVLDLHFVKESMFLELIIDSLFNLFSLLVFLFIFGKYINKRTRLIDILATILIAKIPMFFLPVFNTNHHIYKITENLLQKASLKIDIKGGLGSLISSSDIMILSIFGIITIVVMIWYISLLYNGFKVSSNLKSKMQIFLFILAILLAEISSKFLIYKFN